MLKARVPFSEQMGQRTSETSEAKGWPETEQRPAYLQETLSHTRSYPLKPRSTQSRALSESQRDNFSFQIVQDDRGV